MNEPEQSSNKVWPEDKLEYLLRSLLPLYVKYVRATHLLPNLPFLRQHASKIVKTERKSTEEAARLLFDLIRRCDDPEKWNKFMVALKETEFTSLYKICSFCENDEFVFYTEIFDLLSVDFAEYGVDIVKLSESLLKIYSINQNQFDNIQFILKEEGEVAAILEFFSCLPSNMEKSIKSLRSGLYIIEKPELCKLIDKKGNERINSYISKYEQIIKLQTKIISKRVRPQDIRIYLNLSELISDTVYSSPSQEMESIISNINKSNVLGKWTTFLDALKTEGYESMYMMITDDYRWKDDSEEEKKMQLMTTGNLNTLNVTLELLNDLKIHKLINERCFDEIKAVMDRSGHIAAAEMVFNNIHRFKFDWFKIFLRILTDNQQKDLVKSIDPDYVFPQSTTNIFEGASSDIRPKFAYKANQASMPVSSMKVKYNKPIELTKEEESLTVAGDKKINCIIYVIARRHILAQDIIKNHLKRDENHKVVFLGSLSSVKLQEHLLNGNYRVSNCEMNVSLKNELIRNQVVLLTPQFLKMANLEKSFSYFSLLIIDECHLTIKDHPYNNVMTNYIDSKLVNSGDPLPQIVGLTSSLSHEKPKNMIQADEQIKTICANLDCEKICIFQDGSNYFAFESKEFLFSEKECEENPFKKKVNEAMRKIENHLKDSHVPAKIQEENLTFFELLNDRIIKRDGIFYNKWLADFKRGFTSLNDSETHRCLYYYWKILNTLHTALEIATYCEIKLAFDYIVAEQRRGIDDEIYKTLFRFWDEVKQEINMIIEKGSYQNPQLENLKKYIKEEIMKNKYSRIVVFVKANILFRVIMNWMIDDDELLSLLPLDIQKFKVYRAEMYKDMIGMFNSRDCQLCVVILEDWKLISEKYNLRLDYYDNKEISIKGNSHENALQMEAIDDDSNPELFLHNALIKMKDYLVEDSEEFRKEIRRHQRTAKDERSKKEDSNQDRPLKIGEFSLHCKRCTKLACFSSEIRLFEGERFFVCNPSFIKKLYIKNEIIADSNQRAYKLISCIECCRQWGKIMQERFLLPELKINSFTITDNSKRIVSLERWDSVPFFDRIQQATEEELVKITETYNTE